MERVAHRGFWKIPAQANSLRAIEEAFERGWGIEIDVRQSRGALCISHDPVQSVVECPWEDFTRCWENFPQRSVFLNIKEDGLLPLLIRYLKEWQNRTVVCFDMSVPELFRYTRVLPSTQLATRLSEWEQGPLHSHCNWLWWDGFCADPCLLSPPALAAGKNLAVVSAELHGRAHLEFQQAVKELSQRWPGRVALCTDYPGDL